MNQNRLKAKSLLARNCARLALAGISLTAPSLFAASGIWNGTVGGGDGFWDGTANTEWTGLTGNAWDATNGPNNIAQFNSGVGANPGTAGTPVANGIIWNTGGGVSSGSVKLDGANPFINVTSGATSQMFANLLGTNGFTKTGAGQFFFISSVKAITGGISVNQGLLRLDLNAADGSTASGVANATNFLTLSGSTLELQGRSGGVASSQTLSNFTLSSGGSTIRTNLNGGSGVTLSLANWTRPAGTNANVLIDTSSGSGNKVTLSGTLPTLSNGILGGYATIKDSTGYGFATLSGNDVVRYTGATTVGAALGADTDINTNYKTTLGGAFFNGTGTTQFLNSLDIAFNGTVSGNNAATYVLGSGGLMFSYSSGFPGYKADMNLTSATSELQVSVLPYNSGFASATIRSVADNGGTSVSLIKGGAGGLNMGSGTFTYTGDTVVNQGVLDNIANVPSGAGKGNLVVNSQGIVALGLGASGTRTINGLSNTTVGGGTINNQNYTSTAATASLNLGNNDATASFSGVITGAFGIIKSGNGTQTFSGASNYTGSTSINAGTLLLSGSQSGTASVSVASGATLASGPTGSITTAAAGNVAVSGSLAPGGSTLGAGAGTLTLTLGTGGKLNFAASSTLLFGLGTTSDLVTFNSVGDWLSGSGNATLLLDVTLPGFSYANTYTVFSNVSTDGFVFANITGYDKANYTANVSDAGTSYQVNFTAVPEPNSLISLLAGFGMLAGLRRRRRA